MSDKKLFCMQFPKPKPQWQYIFLITDPESTYIWYMGIFLIVYMSFVIYLYAEFENSYVRNIDFLTICITILGALMLFPVEFIKDIEHKMSKLFILFGLISALAANSVFQSVFYNILLKPRYPPKLNSIVDVMNGNFEFLSTTYLTVMH